jgi:hypothetical protein
MSSEAQLVLGTNLCDQRGTLKCFLLEENPDTCKAELHEKRMFLRIMLYIRRTFPS